ncbi:MAG: DUF1292 domain-containing protein [Clostridia bacterium]|nr:DUF1292 domain-containing protein [Clostridia bacterium]
MANEDKDILDILLDDDNRDPVTLTLGSGKEYEFEQVAVIPYDDKIYAVLHPLAYVEELDAGDDDCLVFYVDEDDPSHTLRTEDDDEKAEAVYDIYISLLEEDGDD